MNSKAMRHLLLGAVGVLALGAVLPLACASPEDAKIEAPGTGGGIAGDASPDVKEAGTGGSNTGGSGGSTGGYGGNTGGSGGSTGGSGGSTGGSGGYGTGGYGTGGYGTGGYGTGGYGTGGYGTGGYSGGGGASGSGGSMAYSGSQLQPSSQCAKGQIFLFGDCRF